MNDFQITTDKDIQTLIQCKKEITTTGKRPASERDITQRFEAYSKDMDCSFRVFIAYAPKLPQDFSIGLMFGDYLLLRCNGFHGTTRNFYFQSDNHHAHPHAHLLTIADIKNGRGKKPSFIENMTGNYVDLKTAESYFFNRCNFINAESYFDVAQLSLF